MMKLWIDDIRNAPDASWTVVRTVNSAVNALSQFDFDVISIDHDISHQVQIGTGLERPFPCEETFMSVAHYIGARSLLRRVLEELPGKGKGPWNPKVIIHSSNVVAAARMRMVLSEYFVEDVTEEPMGMVNRLEAEV